MLIKNNWHSESFGRLDHDFDPQWMLTPAQQELQAQLMEKCTTILRPNAREFDAHRIYPRKNIEVLILLAKVILAEIIRTTITRNLDSGELRHLINTVCPALSPQRSDRRVMDLRKTKLFS